MESLTDLKSIHPDFWSSLPGFAATADRENILKKLQERGVKITRNLSSHTKLCDALS